MRIYSITPLLMFLVYDSYLIFKVYDTFPSADRNCLISKKSYVENYKPVLLMCVAKVLERCIYSYLMDHIEKIIIAQHGFMRG